MTHAANLGIDLADCVEIDGMSAAGAHKPRRYMPGIHGLVMGHKVPLSAVFNPSLPVILLGREDFFDYFHVSVDQPRKRFTLTVHNS